MGHLEAFAVKVSDMSSHCVDSQQQATRRCLHGRMRGTNRFTYWKEYSYEAFVTKIA